MTPEAMDNLMRKAIGLQQSNQFVDADTLYRSVLEHYPNQPDASHLSGLIARQAGRFADSARLIGRAIALNPGEAIYHRDLGLTLVEAGQFEFAIMALRRATELRPDQAEVFVDLGLALISQKAPEKAAAAFGQAVLLGPGLFEAHHHLGNALHQAGQPADAIAAYQKAVALRPDRVDARTALGNALAEQGIFDQAIAVYRAAIALTPTDARLLNNLANALVASGLIPEAVLTYRRAIACEPTLALAHSNLGNALRQSGDDDEAITALSHAVELQPDFASAYNNLGNALKDQGRADEGIAAMRVSVQLDPNSPEMHSNLVYAALFHPEYNAGDHLALARDWADRFEKPLRSTRVPQAARRSGSDRIRLGYVSPDFRQHVVGRNVLPVIEHHDRARFEVHCFMTASNQDEMTARFRRSAEHWHDVSRLNDEALASLVRELRIDILVDLSLHMAGNRLGVFARKPAPVQVTWAGYPGTTGLTAIDYRITDPHSDPPGSGDEQYSEKSVRHPHSFWCYRPPDGTPETNQLPATSAGYVTFGFLNNFAKVSPAALDLWAEVLLAVPGSQLAILIPGNAAADRVRGRFTANGVNEKRLNFIARTSPAEYMSLYHQIHICLDPIPYTGHTTTLDALWMGVPVVTLAGQSAVARGSVTGLTHVALSRLIAAAPSEYIQIARNLSTDVEALSKLRSQLRSRMQNSPLCNEKQFTLDLESVYLAMWTGWYRSMS